MVWGWSGHFLAWTMTAWFLGLVGLVGWAMASGRLPMRSMLAPRPGESDGVDRLQLFAAVLFGLVYYLVICLKAPREALAMPDVPDQLLWALGGSQGFYLLTKFKQTMDQLGGAK